MFFVNFGFFKKFIKTWVKNWVATTMIHMDDHSSNLINHPKYGRLMMLAKLANIGMTGPEEVEYETLVAIRVQNS